MNKSASITILFSLCLLLQTGVMAQNVKLGYVNSLELLSLMPETKTADSLLANYQTELQEQYQAYLFEYQNKSSELTAKSDSLSQTALEAKVADLQSLETRIKEFEQSSQTKLQEKRDELYKPILQKATDMVGEVAKENGYYYIFDISSGAVAFAPEGENVIELLKAKIEAGY